MSGLHTATGDDLDAIGKEFFIIERFEDEPDDEFRTRMVNKYMRYRDTAGTFYDLVHTAEQALIHQTPVGCDFIAIRRQVGLGLIAKNKTGNFLTRLKTAFKAFWSCL